MKINDIIQKTAVNHLLDLCIEELELSSMPEIEFIEDKFIKNNNKMSFGMFDGNKITVVFKGRHIIDILRTLAHELTHWKQKQLEMDMDGNDGSETENEANAAAGIIMRKFGERYPDYFLNSLPD